MTQLCVFPWLQRQRRELLIPLLNSLKAWMRLLSGYSDQTAPEGARLRLREV